MIASRSIKTNVAALLLLLLHVVLSSVSGLLQAIPPTTSSCRRPRIGRNIAKAHDAIAAAPTSTSRSTEERDEDHEDATNLFLIPDLHAELKTVDLGLCHGILHSSGVRRLADLQHLTDEQIVNMGVDSLDRRNIVRARDAAAAAAAGLLTKTTRTSQQQRQRPLSTQIDGAFDQPIRQRFQAEEKHDFGFEAICGENEVFKGRLFTVEQCEQLNRMAEYSAYWDIGAIGAGWTNEVYTLTAQHMVCKNIPGMIPTTKRLFRQLFQELYPLFGNRIRPGTICFESDREPHLVKYTSNGGNKAKRGTQLHTDNSEYIYITVNVALSDAEEDYTGGGTYIPKLIHHKNRTIRLQQGEMLIHLGDLEHAGAEITSGVRHLLIAFLACEWKEDALNQAKLENGRDYVAPSSPPPPPSLLELKEVAARGTKEEMGDSR